MKVEENKGLCSNCVEYEEESRDYRTVYCEKCWTIGELCRQKINELKEEIDTLRYEWKKSM